jgi:HSP20 family protein
MPNTLFPTSFRASSLGRLSQEMDRLFQTAAAMVEPSPAHWPGVNVWRQDDTIVVETEIPGFAQQDVEVLATHDSLTIRGERSLQAPENATPLHIEQEITRFERVVGLPTPVDPNAVQAELVNGVLRLTLPVAQEARARRIQIVGRSEPSRPALTCETNAKR